MPCLYNNAEDDSEDIHVTNSWSEWINRAMLMLPPGASVGNAMELREILEAYVKEHSL